MNLSFTAIVFNEATRIPAFIGMVKDFVDEVVIVDTGSTDETVELLKQSGCTVLETTMEHGFSAARNIGLGACKGDWILSLDADETVSTTFMRWCAQYVQKASPKTYAASFTRHNFVDDAHVGDEEHIRLFRKAHGSWRGKIHEFVVVNGRIHKAHERCVIQHKKTAAMQVDDNIRYLDYYPKYNLGSGGRPREGWMNLDLDPKAPEAIYADVFQELPGNLPAAEILASHVLEHASYHDAAQVVHMWVDKLAPGGTIEIRVPDLTTLVRDCYTGELSYLGFIQMMYGGHTSEHDHHHTAIDFPWICGQLKWWGCVDIRTLTPTQEYELRVVGRKPS